MLFAVFLLLHFESSFPFLISKQLVRKEVSQKSSPLSLEILQIAPKAQSSDFTLSCRPRSKFISGSFKLKLNSDSSDEKEMVLKQNLDVLVPKYIGTIIFACHFPEHIQRADWGAIVFGAWVDVISNCRPRLRKTRSCNTSSATLRGHRKSRIQTNSKIFGHKCFE